MSVQTSSTDRTRLQIEHLVGTQLQGRKIDIVKVVDDLLALVREVGELRCVPVANQFLRFTIAGQSVFDVGLDAAVGRLRIMCARLAVLCQESGQEFTPYGGQGIIKKAVGAPQANYDSLIWHVRFKNTTDAQEFTITAVEDTNSCP